MQIIIKPNEQNRVVIISPAPGVDIQTLAQTLQGPYRIINTSDLPAGEEWAYSDGPISAVTRVPAEITKAQLIRATREIEYAPGVSLWSAIKSAISSMDQDTQDEWEAITKVPRNHPLVLAAGEALNVADQMDAVWIAGSQL